MLVEVPLTVLSFDDVSARHAGDADPAISPTIRNRALVDDGRDHPLTAFIRSMGHRTWSRAGALWIDVGRFTLGRGWLPAEPTIDRFKRHAGCVEEPLQLAVVLHPRWGRPLQSPLTQAMMRGADALTVRRTTLGADLDVLRAAALTRSGGDPARG
jgi:hypothetical protein